MNYRELQQTLHAHKENGLTTITLNSKKAVLEAELERIESLLLMSCEKENNEHDIDIDDSQAVEAFFTEAKQTMSKLVAKYSDSDEPVKTENNSEKIADKAEVSASQDLATNVTTQPKQPKQKSIFPPTPDGLINAIVHLIQCTYILVTYYLGLHKPDIYEQKVELQTSSIVYESIFPPKPNGLINATVHLGICTYILLEHLLFPKPRIPVIYMAGSYQ